MDSDKSVDIRGLCCAQPIIALTKELKSMQTGEVLLATSDKSSMANDIPAFCRQTGHLLVSQEESGGIYRFWISKV
jgi:TusA-related sulfurtransferase